jgi:hypothetical protein
MRSVYVVSFCVAYEGCSVQKVFTSHELAQAYLDRTSPGWEAEAADPRVVCFHAIDEFKVEDSLQDTDTKANDTSSA